MNWTPEAGREAPASIVAGRALIDRTGGLLRAAPVAGGRTKGNPTRKRAIAMHAGCYCHRDAKQELDP